MPLERHATRPELIAAGPPLTASRGAPPKQTSAPPTPPTPPAPRQRASALGH